MSDAITFNPTGDALKALLSKVAYENISANFDLKDLRGDFSVAEKNILQITSDLDRKKII